jgi:acetyl esterase/lipase
MHVIRLLCLTLLLPSLGSCQPGETPPTPPHGILAVRDLNYAGTANWRQTLDLYVPEKPPSKPLPLVLFIHGGGWEQGSKNSCGIIFNLLADHAFIGASINYRLTNEGPHPAQIHDCKGAVRWLRAHAADYGIDKEKIAVFGISAGGHLVSLLGTSGEVKAMEGDIGGHLEQSSRVSCVVNFCGPVDFLTFGGKGSAIDPENAHTAVGKLIGGKVSEHTEAAKSASPVTYITKDDPPFLHIHGTNDNLVPLDQPKEFDAALESAGISSTLLIGEGGGHVFVSPELMTDIRTFLDKHLLGKSSEVKEGPVAIH